MKRVILIVLDSVGAGELPDAALYGDEGANTLGNIVKARGLDVPNMLSLGLGHISAVGLAPDPQARGGFGRMAEKSPGKDTTTGHWELAGIRLEQAFPTFPDGFPVEFIARFEQMIGTRTLGNIAASGTTIINQLGDEHVKTGYPIVYTSADSVFQIAAHVDVIPLDRLYEICQIARGMLTGPLRVGRVIARPFAGKRNGAYARTPERRDFSLTPIGETILDVLKAKGLDTIGVGKIEDIFAHRGLTDSDHAEGNAECMASMINFLKTDFDGLLFVNLVDFDMHHGHRRDVEHYAQALETFDRQLPDVLALLGKDDLLLISADHGCDPTFRGTDHTREYVPLLAYGRWMNKVIDLGTRATFADVAATVADYFGAPERFDATTFLDQIIEGKT